MLMGKLLQSAGYKMLPSKTNGPGVLTIVVLMPDYSGKNGSMFCRMLHRFAYRYTCMGTRVFCIIA